MAMQQFQELDTTNQQIAFIAWWRHYWADPRLAWDPADWGGITELTFFGHEEHKQIWTPDTIIYEAIESDCQIPGGVQPCVEITFFAVRSCWIVTSSFTPSTRHTG